LKIFIFGLGHLSRFFVDELDDSFTIEGTWRTEKEGFDKVQNKIQFETGDEWPKEIKDQYDWIVWSYPPVGGYKEILKKADQFFNSKTPWIFVSSTSVYDQGEVNENSERKGKKFRGENLVEIENLLYGFNRPINIIRPSGLVDEKRNPANFFKNTDRKPEIKGERVNLVHTHDVARFLWFVIKNDIKGEDFNLNSQTDLEKSEFYKKVLRFFNIPKIEFLDSKSSSPKTVNSMKSRSYGFSYQFDDLVNYYKDLSSRI
jgi:nucleoside-diphosphate-sugar epimerase